MKLATIEAPRPCLGEELFDGRLVVVSSNHHKAALIPDESCLTMRRALDNWSTAESKLKEVQALLESGKLSEELDVFKLKLKAPLPRANDFIDGSSYLSHIERVRKARGVELPEDIKTYPLMYRGIPQFLGSYEDVIVMDFTHGPDFEAELAVIVDEVPQGVTPERALSYVKLITQINDISLRTLIKLELPRQFGFLISKPPSSAGPFAITPDELGKNWNAGRPNLIMKVELNGQKIGELDTSELHFSIGELISHASKTHALSAGTVIGTGTISNLDSTRGVACLAEQVALDVISGKKEITSFLQIGDIVTIEALNQGSSIFGKLTNKFVKENLSIF